MKYDLVLFDLDGTLVNTLEAITKSTNEALKELGLKQYTLEEGKNLIGHGVEGIVKKVFELEKYDEKVVKKEMMLETIRKNYDIYFNYNVKLYDGIDILLDYLDRNGIKYGIVTNKVHKLALETVKENLSSWNFIEILGENTKKYPKKPNPYGVEYICNKYGIEKDRVLFVGDMIVDVETAKNADVDIVYCNWGIGNLKNENISSEIRVNSVNEIIKKIENK